MATVIGGAIQRTKRRQHGERAEHADTNMLSAQNVVRGEISGVCSAILPAYAMNRIERINTRAGNKLPAHHRKNNGKTKTDGTYLRGTR